MTMDRPAATARFPQSFEVTAVLDDDPGYPGTAHDHATARSMGYRAALIPGAFVYGYATRLAVRAWGMDWLARGTISARFRRPVYDGDRLTVAAGALVEDGSGVRADLTVTNGEGEAVLTGAIGLPHAAETPVAMLEFHPIAPRPPALSVSDVVPGLRFGTEGAVLGREAVTASRRAFGETEPIYDAEDVVPSGTLVRLTMRDVLRSYKLPMPPIFAAVEATNYAPVRPGALMRTSAEVVEAYERNGAHYFVSDELLVADEIIVARHRRVNLYAR